MNNMQAVALLILFLHASCVHAEGRTGSGVRSWRTARDEAQAQLGRLLGTKHGDETHPSQEQKAKEEPQPELPQTAHDAAGPSPEPLMPLQAERCCPCTPDTAPEQYPPASWSSLWGHALCLLVGYMMGRRRNRQPSTSSTPTNMGTASATHHCQTVESLTQANHHPTPSLCSVTTQRASGTQAMGLALQDKQTLHAAKVSHAEACMGSQRLVQVLQPLLPDGQTSHTLPQPLVPHQDAPQPLLPVQDTGPAAESGTTATSTQQTAHVSSTPPHPSGAAGGVPTAQGQASDHQQPHAVAQQTDPHQHSYTLAPSGPEVSVLDACQAVAAAMTANQPSQLFGPGLEGSQGSGSQVLAWQVVAQHGHGELHGGQVHNASPHASQQQPEQTGPMTDESPGVRDRGESSSNGRRGDGVCCTGAAAAGDGGTSSGRHGVGDGHSGGSGNTARGGSDDCSAGVAPLRRAWSSTNLRMTTSTVTVVSQHAPPQPDAQAHLARTLPLSQQGQQQQGQVVVAGPGGQAAVPAVHLELKLSHAALDSAVQVMQAWAQPLVDLSVGVRRLVSALCALSDHAEAGRAALERATGRLERLSSAADRWLNWNQLASQQVLVGRCMQLGVVLMSLTLLVTSAYHGRLHTITLECAPPRAPAAAAASQAVRGVAAWFVARSPVAPLSSVMAMLRTAVCTCRQLGMFGVGLFTLHWLLPVAWGVAGRHLATSWQVDIPLVMGGLGGVTGAAMVHWLGGCWTVWLLSWWLWCGLTWLMCTCTLGSRPWLRAALVLGVVFIMPLLTGWAPFWVAVVPLHGSLQGALVRVLPESMREGLHGLLPQG